MPREVNEALLEMHFHGMLLETFQQTLGGPHLRLWKPTLAEETVVAFDQGWVSTSCSLLEFKDRLRGALSSSKPGPIRGFLVGYFLQFKCVDTMSRRSRLAPPSILSPYLRAEVDLTPSDSSLSQHEILVRLSSVADAYTFYGCGMVFSQQQVLAGAQPGQLRLIDIRTAPPFRSSERHFIVFQDEQAPAQWCSTAVDANELPVERWPAALMDGLRTPEVVLQNLEAIETEWLSIKAEHPSTAWPSGALNFLEVSRDAFHGSISISRSGRPAQGTHTITRSTDYGRFYSRRRPA